MLQTWVGVTSHNCWRALAWSALLIGTLLLAWLFQGVATVSTEGVVQADATPINTSSASLVFAKDIDARRRSLADADANCKMSVEQPLYVGQNTWVTQAWRCVDLLP